MIEGYDKRIETVLDALLSLSNKYNVELIVERTFDEEDKMRMSCMVSRSDNGRYGIISTDVVEYPDEPIVFLIFNSKLYSYAKTEGFDLPGMLSGFDNEIFKKVSMKEYFDYLIKDDE
jgi:hypothetical protein|tara:strand:+ start:517 stop:870 length:354 start_codon:yes stop_codon:yes gene_type:complete